MPPGAQRALKRPAGVPAESLQSSAAGDWGPFGHEAPSTPPSTNGGSASHCSLIPGSASASSTSQAAPAGAPRQAYGAQLLDTSLPGHRRPRSFSKEGFGVLLQRRHEEAFAERASSLGLPANKVLKVIAFQELHSNGEIHFWAAILCDRQYQSKDIGKRLRDQDNVYVSFRRDHQYVWAAVIYGGVASVHKGLDEIDRNPYHSEGKTLREELADIPRGARAVDKERVRHHPT
jgi:hypothetical protein